MSRTICDMTRYKRAIFREHNTSGLKRTASYWSYNHVLVSIADVNKRNGQFYNEVRKSTVLIRTLFFILTWQLKQRAGRKNSRAVEESVRSASCSHWSIRQTLRPQGGKRTHWACYKVWHIIWPADDPTASADHWISPKMDRKFIPPLSS